MNKIYLTKRSIFLVAAIVAITLLLSGCNLFQGKPDETTEPSFTYITGTLTLRLIDRDGQPLEGKEMLASTLPEESSEVLERTDSEGKTQWDGAKTGTQHVLATVDDKVYKFEGEIRESDFNTTITLQIVKENKIENGNYRFLRETDEKIPVNSEGSAASLVSVFCPSIDVQSLTYEQAIGDPRVSARMATQEQIGPYPITTIYYFEKSDALFFFAKDESIEDGMVHAKILVDSTPLTKDNSAEYTPKYPTLSQLKENGLSAAQIAEYNYSVFEDGYEIYCINGDYLYHIVVNGSKELLDKTIALLK